MNSDRCDVELPRLRGEVARFIGCDVPRNATRRDEPARVSVCVMHSEWYTGSDNPTCLKRTFFQRFTCHASSLLNLSRRPYIKADRFATCGGSANSHDAGPEFASRCVPRVTGDSRVGGGTPRRRILRGQLPGVSQLGDHRRWPRLIDDSLRAWHNRELRQVGTDPRPSSQTRDAAGRASIVGTSGD